MLSKLREEHPYFFAIVGRQLSSPRQIIAMPLFLSGVLIFAVGILLVYALALTASYIIKLAANISGDAHMRELAKRFDVGVTPLS